MLNTYTWFGKRQILQSVIRMKFNWIRISYSLHNIHRHFNLNGIYNQIDEIAFEMLYD